MYKKIIAVLVFATVLCLPFVVGAATWERSFEFKVALNSPDYNLKSGSVSVRTFNKSNPGWKQGSPTVFYITLMDKNGKSYGMKTQDRFSAATSSWSVPSSGTYFRWTKANDNSTLIGRATITN
ncbi:hypothetical protein PQ478_10465 [Alkalihalophilus pseudofirmus]|uniref:hypothetical protein n=1 Tax=Alkalihalophilus pseudofirmus TaxID=79885 RepID=UPI00259BC988|nr:hypothetical protein [Alkalihalophilus pseudofirmus]WEG18884.1 hypothetical protein PQ478_10465 [Alkalihalophilus pseudofirmus]